MTVPITTRAAKGSKLLTTEVDDNFLAGKAAIEELQSTVSSIVGAATDTTIADTATAKIMLEIDGVPKLITVDDLIAAISTPASGLAVAAALSGSDIITISQDGGATEVRTTLSALAVFLGATPVAATGITLSGPTSGLSGSASTNFTVGVTPSGGTLTGTVTVTPSDSSGGGTFTPTTVSLTTSGPTATFTYTPASTGAKTISITNNGSLTNPSNITYTASASATAPGAPTGVTATAGNASASVAFTAPASNGGSAITGYTVTSSPGGFTGTGSTSPITVTGLTNGTGYTFTVTATNAIGTGSASSASSASTPSAGATVPGAPTIGTATGGNAQATVTFTAPASNGGSAITGYTVTSNPAGGTDSNAGTTGLSHVITGLSNGTAYTFTATATNAIGTGAASSASSSVTPSAGTSYTITGYSGNTVNATADAAAWTVYGALKYSAQPGPMAGQYWSMTPTPASAVAGWGTSGTVEPDTIIKAANASAGSSVNGMCPMTHPGQWTNESSLWVPSGSGTSTWYFWVKPVDGVAQMKGSCVVSNA